MRRRFWTGVHCDRLIKKISIFKSTCYHWWFAALSPSAHIPDSKQLSSIFGYKMLPHGMARSQCRLTKQFCMETINPDDLTALKFMDGGINFISEEFLSICYRDKPFHPQEVLSIIRLRIMLKRSLHLANKSYIYCWPHWYRSAGQLKPNCPCFGFYTLSEETSYHYRHGHQDCISPSYARARCHQSPTWRLNRSSELQYHLKEVSSGQHSVTDRKPSSFL